MFVITTANENRVITHYYAVLVVKWLLDAIGVFANERYPLQHLFANIEVYVSIICSFTLLLRLLMKKPKWNIDGNACVAWGSQLESVRDNTTGCRSAPTRLPLHQMHINAS